MTDGYYMKSNVIPDSVIRIELLTYFHRNPGAENTAMELAECIGRRGEQVECQIRKLVQLGILNEKPVAGEFVYKYIPPFSISMFKQKKDSRAGGRGRDPINNGRNPRLRT